MIPDSLDGEPSNISAPGMFLFTEKFGVNCSSDSWKEDLVVLGRCEGRRRSGIRKRVSGVLVEEID